MTCLSRLSVLASACNSWLLASNSAVNSAGLPPSPLDLIIKTRLGQGRALLLPRKKPSDLGTDSGNTAVLYIQSTAKSSDRDQKADWCCFSLTPSVRCQGMIALDSWKDRVAVIWCYLCILQIKVVPSLKQNLELVSLAGFTLSWHISSPPMHSAPSSVYPNIPSPSTHSPTSPSLTRMSCLPAPLLSHGPKPTPALPQPQTGPALTPASIPAPSPSAASALPAPQARSSPTTGPVLPHTPNPTPGPTVPHTLPDPRAQPLLTQTPSSGPTTPLTPHALPIPRPPDCNPHSRPYNSPHPGPAAPARLSPSLPTPAPRGRLPRKMTDTQLNQSLPEFPPLPNGRSVGGAPGRC